METSVMTEGQPCVRVSVRNLVEFVLRKGDIDNRRTAGAKKEAMEAGARLHRKIQKRMGAAYQAEVSLKHSVCMEEFQIQVEGRADGILTEPGGAVIDEIKCMYLEPDSLEEPDPLHVAQAMCYGYIYSLQKELPSIGIQITCCSIETEQIRRFREEKTFEELEQWFTGLLHEYLKWARYLHHHRLRRQESLKELQFPYAYREGQKELAVSVYRCISRKRNLYIQAPTGVGKTLSTVFPSLKAMGEGMGEKLFYLTARTITRRVAEEAFDLLREREQLYFNTVTITAKEKLCILERPDCNPAACPRAKGHFDRVNDGVYEILHRETGITREKVLQYAEEFSICPFEFCLDISSWTDGIICDYNYVFDPDVRLKRYFAEGSGQEEYLFLVDEAHNLVPRAREMYSAALKKEELLEVGRMIKREGGRSMLRSLIASVNRILLAQKREGGLSPEEREQAGWRQAPDLEYRILPDIKPLALKLMSLFAELETFLNDHPEFDGRETVLEFYFQVRSFLAAYDRLDECYRIYGGVGREGEYELRLLCIDPSACLRECLSQSRATLFFSATLLPVRYYKELLSGDPEEYAVYAGSPFDRRNRLVLTVSDVSSRFSRRGRSLYRRIVEYIRVIVGGKKGNYMVFLPSYRFLEEIEGLLLEEKAAGRIDFSILSQSSRMKESEREEFLRVFEEEREDSLAALCVMGGIFSEGIDLKEERLIGAIVVGTGLPGISAEQEILREYFQEKSAQGFEYAYRYPGMNKVLQAGGRVIRTAADRGVIALLDDRFSEAELKGLFPREWEPAVHANLKTLPGLLKEFWQGS